jgi:hypothetical protein
MTPLLAGFLLIAACGDPTASNQPAAPAPGAASTVRGASAGENQDLATLRATLGPLHRFDAAQRAGWDDQFPPGCFVNADSGGMGFHYLNARNMGVLDPARPQLLIFEPEKNGQRKLVGVEFILPGDPTDTPPVLFEQTLTYNFTFKVWALHVWALVSNPGGTYAYWTPKVSCRYSATPPKTMHH